MPRGSLVGVGQGSQGPQGQQGQQAGLQGQGTYSPGLQGQGTYSQGFQGQGPFSPGSYAQGPHGPHGQGDSNPMGTPSTPPLFMSCPTRGFSGDDSGYQTTSHPGSPLPLNMSTPGRSSSARCRGRLDSSGSFPPPSPTATMEGTSVDSVVSRQFRIGSHSIGERRGAVGPDTRSLLTPGRSRNSCSRSDSPESDTSLNSLDNANMSDLMNCLYYHARTRTDSGLSTGLSSGCEEPRDQQQQELNLTNLHALQSLNLQHSQQSPLSSPLSSPLASPDKVWSPGSVTNSLSNSLSSSLPGSPLFMSSPSPLRGPLSTPATPTSPGPGPMARTNSSWNSNKFFRNVGAPQCDTVCTWTGALPPRNYENASFSVKVFLGGVPWDITDNMLVNSFKHFGMIRVEWPSTKPQGGPQPKGYVYIIFECEKQVKALLQACTHDFSKGRANWYFKVSSKRMKAKDVQVIPWITSDTNWVRSPSQKLDPQKTVFVGGLHGMMNALGLAMVMNDLFGGVVYAGIDTDKFKYPIGSARVTFNNNRSFFKAVNARFILIKADQFHKKVQVDPYLEDSPCSLCSVQHGPYFCRESSCFRYFCRSCWFWRHLQDFSLSAHTPLMRNSKYRAIESGMGLNMALPSKGQVAWDLARLPRESLQ